MAENDAPSEKNEGSLWKIQYSGREISIRKICSFYVAEMGNEGLRRRQLWKAKSVLLWLCDYNEGKVCIALNRVKRTHVSVIFWVRIFQKVVSVPIVPKFKSLKASEVRISILSLWFVFKCILENWFTITAKVFSTCFALRSWIHYQNV